MQVAERGFPAIAPVVFVPFLLLVLVIFITVPVKVKVRCVKFVGIFRMGIIVCLVPVVAIPFEGVLIGKCVFLTQNAVYFELSVGKLPSMATNAFASLHEAPTIL